MAKIPPLEIKFTQAIRITNVEQLKKLLPDLEIKTFTEFFITAPYHTEYLALNYSDEKGLSLNFCNPNGKEIIEFEDLKID